jgi:hypothetical protein
MTEACLSRRFPGDRNVSLFSLKTEAQPYDPGVRGGHLKNLAFVIYCPRKIMCLAVDTHENLVQMPAPARIRMVLNVPFSDLHGKHRAKTVPSEPYRLVADIDASFIKKILDLPQRQRIPDIHHHRQADNLGRRFKITKWVSHPQRLRAATVSLKPFCSDIALNGLYIGTTTKRESYYDN